MPVGVVSTDLTQLVHSAVERNSGIPAILDAYSEFVDSPIGPLELADLESVFSAILGNLSERFPQIASQKAATNARNDIASFLSASSNNVERIKSVLGSELKSASKTMASSISERFSRASPEERRAIDATLRLVRKSREEIIFRAEAGKGIETSGPDFDRFFAAVRAQSPGIKELRFQNLIVEKGIFNKLVLKTRDRRNSSIWIPSFFAKENLDYLIERVAVTSEHVFYSRLRELKDQNKLDPLRPLLTRFVENLGVLPTESEGQTQRIPEEIEDFVYQTENKKFIVLTPLELDDVSALFREELQERRRVEEEGEKKEEEKRKDAEARESERIEGLKRQQEERRRSRNPQLGQSTGEKRDQPSATRSGDSIYLGKTFDLDEFSSALGRRLGEKEIEAQVKPVGDYFVDLSDVRQNGVTVVGSSGSGRSTTLRRLLDGLASATSSENLRIIVVDQKGEHRGIAWKYKWPVLAFVSDSQSKPIRLPSYLQIKEEEGGSELTASLIQEWALSAGVNCTDQQRTRIASLIKAQNGSATPESLTRSLQSEPELTLIGQKLARNILSKGAFSRIFSEETKLLDIGTGSTVFDVSGRGLRDPTTKEERLISSVLILKALLDSDLRSSIIVLEDVLDRFKSEALRKKVIAYVKRLREKGNTIVATSRSQIRDYMGGTSLEILHRLSGEKVVSEEISGFKISRQIRNLATIVTFLPRGYALTSSIDATAGSIQGVPSSAIKVEPLKFSTAVS